jgi:hypothetical protein
MLGGEAVTSSVLQIKDGRFVDDRWISGRWDLSKFANAAGETDWDKVGGGSGGRGPRAGPSPLPTAAGDSVCRVQRGMRGADTCVPGPGQRTHPPSPLEPPP